MLGGASSGWQPEYVRVPGGTHWFLTLGQQRILLDPTKRQFRTESSIYTPDYRSGVRCGFLTKAPSKRARELMDRILWKNPNEIPEHHQSH